MFDMQGRIGRVRYMVYGTVIPFLLMVAAGVGIMMVPGNSVMTLGIFLFIPIAGTFKVAQRRMHDLDLSGWWLALIFVPVLGAALPLYLLFGRGSAGVNRFGPAPEPNSKKLELAAWTVMVAFALSAVALIPAYRNFAEKLADALEASQASSLTIAAQDSDG